MDSINLKKIFYKGVENSSFISGEKSISMHWVILRTIRLLLWFPFVNFRKKTLNSRTLKLLYAPLHQVILNDEEGESVIVCFSSKGYKNPSNLFSNYVSYFSVVKFLFRIPHDVKHKGLSYNWLFFCILNEFIVNTHPQKITIAGIYDCNTTWIAYLCKCYNIELCISQHGICAPYNVPNKIPVDKVKVFCEAEKKIFENIVLEPTKVEYFVKGYRTSVIFDRGNFNLPTIAVASQPGYEHDVVRIIQSIFEYLVGFDVIIYAHPYDSFRTKGSISIDDHVIPIVDKKRFLDINVLIIINSTIAYDYLACKDFNGRIFSYHIGGLDLSVYHHESIITIEPEAFGETLCDYLTK